MSSISRQYKKREIQSVSGEWSSSDFSRRQSRRRHSSVFAAESDVCDTSTRRSWSATLTKENSQRLKTSLSRDSRVYSSLPRNSTYRMLPGQRPRARSAERNEHVPNSEEALKSDPVLSCAIVPSLALGTTVALALPDCAATQNAVTSVSDATTVDAVSTGIGPDATAIASNTAPTSDTSTAPTTSFIDDTADDTTAILNSNAVVASLSTSAAIVNSIDGAIASVHAGNDPSATACYKAPDALGADADASAAVDVDIALEPAVLKAESLETIPLEAESLETAPLEATSLGTAAACVTDAPVQKLPEWVKYIRPGPDSSPEESPTEQDAAFIAPTPDPMIHPDNVGKIRQPSVVVIGPSDPVPRDVVIVNPSGAGPDNELIIIRRPRVVIQPLHVPAEMQQEDNFLPLAMAKELITEEDELNQGGEEAKIAQNENAVEAARDVILQETREDGEACVGVEALATQDEAQTTQGGSYKAKDQEEKDDKEEEVVTPIFGFEQLCSVKFEKIKLKKQEELDQSTAREKEVTRHPVSEEESTGASGGSPAPSPAPSPAAAYLLDYALDAGKIQPESDDYKLVFINSDSSSKGSNSDIEFATDDCDWDYFESTLQQQQQQLQKQEIQQQQIQQHQIKKEVSSTSTTTSLLGSGSFSDAATYERSNYTQAYLNRHFKDRVTPDEISIPEFHFDRYWPGLYGGGNNTEFLRWTGIPPPSNNIRHPCENCGSDAASILQGLCTGTNLIPVPVPYPVPVPVPVPFGAEADLAYLDNALRIKIRSFQPPPPHILLQTSPFGFNWQSILRNENLTQQSTSSASWINTEKAEEKQQPVQCNKPIQCAALASTTTSEGSVCSEKAAQQDVSTIVVATTTNKMMTSDEIKTQTPDEQLSSQLSIDNNSCEVSIQCDMVETVVNKSEKIYSESDIPIQIESDNELLNNINVDGDGDDTSSGDDMQVATLQSDTEDSNNDSDTTDSDDENNGHFSRVFVVNPENESENEQEEENENILLNSNNLASTIENNEIINGVQLKNIRQLDIGEDPGYASELSEYIRNGPAELSSSIDDLNSGTDTDTPNIIETDPLQTILHISEDENIESNNTEENVLLEQPDVDADSSSTDNSTVHGKNDASTVQGKNDATTENKDSNIMKDIVDSENDNSNKDTEINIDDNTVVDKNTEPEENSVNKTEEAISNVNENMQIIAQEESTQNNETTDQDEKLAPISSNEENIVIEETDIKNESNEESSNDNKNNKNEENISEVEEEKIIPITPEDNIVDNENKTTYENILPSESEENKDTNDMSDSKVIENDITCTEKIKNEIYEDKSSIEKIAQQVNSKNNDDVISNIDDSELSSPDICSNLVLGSSDVSQEIQNTCAETQQSTAPNTQHQTQDECKEENTMETCNDIETQLEDKILIEEISECTGASNLKDKSEADSNLKSIETITETLNTEKENMQESQVKTNDILQTETKDSEEIEINNDNNEAEKINIEKENNFVPESDNNTTKIEEKQNENITDIVSEICYDIIEKVCNDVENASAQNAGETKLNSDDKNCDGESLDTNINESTNIKSDIKNNETTPTNMELHISEDDLENNENKFDNEEDEDYDLVPLLDDITSTPAVMGANIASDPAAIIMTNTVAAEAVAATTTAASGATPTTVELESASDTHSPRNSGGYTSYVMITQDGGNSAENTIENNNTSLSEDERVNVSVIEVSEDEVKINHTNSGDELNPSELIINNDITPTGLAGYFTLTLETGVENSSPTPRKPEVKLKKQVITNNINNEYEENVQIITGDKTMSHAVLCLEEGLADDDSWVEEVDDADSSNFSESSGDEAYMDREEELRGYHRAIDFTLHTILEESCEESEDEAKPSTSGTIKKEDKTELEKYFFFGLGGSSSFQQNKTDDDNSDTQSESSIISDALQEDDIIIDSKQQLDPAELASSRLEKYFLTSFLEPHSTDALSDNTDESGSVGSDSEGKPSPEQRRKKLVRARGTGRHSDRGPDSLAPSDVSGSELPETNDDSTETDSYNDEPNFGIDGLDTVKRKKKKQPSRLSTSTPNISAVISPPPPTAEVQDGQAAAESGSEPEDGAKTPQPDLPAEPPPPSRKHHSRDSGFIGSCDDLLRTGPSGSSSGAGSGGSGSDREPDSAPVPNETTPTVSPAPPRSPVPPLPSGPPPSITKPSPVPPTRANLARKDSFNNWSSDEETNLMMCKMRAFFKTMVAGGNKNNNSNNSNASNSSTTTVASTTSSSTTASAPATKVKPPQLVYFESELTRLMKTVPGIKDEQVREIVEYLSSEDTWSDSYDSSDYTSSDLEGATFGPRTELQQQISASCQEIIQKFDSSSLSDSNDSPIQQHQREDTFVYQRLVASLSRVASNENNLPTSTPVHNSPPLIAKVMHHIGSRLVALMHEVSAAGDPSALLANATAPSPKPRFRRLQRQQQSPTSSSVDESDSPGGSDTERSTSGRMRRHPSLPRSKSHDLGQWQQLLQDAERRGVPRESLRSSSSGVSDLAEEREDYERFSWRGSFESALAADSRTKLSLEAKRRSTGSGSGSASDLFSSSDQLDRRGRVRSCGSIGSRASLPGRAGTRLSSSGGDLLTAAETEEGLLDSNSRRRGSVPDAITPRSTTLPRSNPAVSASTNSLPRLPLSASPVVAAIHKSYSAQLHAAPSTSPHHSPHHTHHHHFLQNVKSARYRPPNFRPPSLGPPKRAVSAPGLHHTRRPERRRGANLGDEGAVGYLDEMNASSKSLNSPGSVPTPSHTNPQAAGGNASSPAVLNSDWPTPEEDIDCLAAMHHHRVNMSTLGLLDLSYDDDTQRSESMASVYSGAGDCRYGFVTVRGEVEFALQYNYKAGALEILVKQCRDLAPVDSKRMRSDPYVKVYLLPDKSKGGKRKTKVKKHTLNPVFDETLKFQATLLGLETRTLWLTVWHSDMFGRNDFLGEVRMMLENKVFDDPSPKWYPLQERTEPLEDLLSYKGDIIVALKFIPPEVSCLSMGKKKISRGALHVLVKEAKNLTAVRGTSGSSDPFCKSYLLPDKGRGSKQKTSVAKRTCNPAWNHTFIYPDVTLQDLSERSLELTVWDHDRLASNEFLGGLRFNLGNGKHYGKNVDWMDATGRESALWQNMLEKPNLWVEGSLTLRPSLGLQSSSSTT